jgi:hypothetical protein
MEIKLEICDNGGYHIVMEIFPIRRSFHAKDKDEAAEIVKTLVLQHMRNTKTPEEAENNFKDLLNT